MSTFHTFPLFVGIYSAFLGLFVPSAGGKWLIEAPYVLPAAQSPRRACGMGGADLQRDRGARQSHSPVLDAAAHRILGLKPRDIVGYSILQLVVHVPIVLLLVWALNYTF